MSQPTAYAVSLIAAAIVWRTVGAMTRLTASDGHELDAYEVHPDGAAASIVIVQEIFA